MYIGICVYIYIYIYMCIHIVVVIVIIVIILRNDNSSQASGVDVRPEDLLQPRGQDVRLLQRLDT